MAIFPLTKWFYTNAMFLVALILTICSSVRQWITPEIWYLRDAMHGVKARDGRNSTLRTARESVIFALLAALNSR
jgi:hypothetical protein